MKWIWKFTEEEVKKYKKPSDKDMYCTKDKVGCKNKKEVNSKLADLSKDNREMAIVLDASTLQTSKALMKVGYRQHSILIPNPYCYNEIVTKRKTKFGTFNMHLGELLNQTYLYQKSISVAFFDYCCTFSGNEKVQPKNDIKTYFKKGLPKNNSVFAATFSKRDGKTPGNVMQTARIYIHTTAKKYGYRAERVYQKEYADHGAMFVLMYKVYKN